LSRKSRFGAERSTIQSGELSPTLGHSCWVSCARVGLVYAGGRGRGLNTDKWLQLRTNLRPLALYVPPPVLSRRMARPETFVAERRRGSAIEHHAHPEGVREPGQRACRSEGQPAGLVSVLDQEVEPDPPGCIRHLDPPVPSATVLGITAP
jgi:hypothetical protein